MCVHGALDRGASFGRVRRRLRHHDVITYDRRGYAGSLGVPVEGGVDRHVADMAAIIGEHPAVVVGHSFGGLIALASAEQFPGRVSAVVVYEPPLSWLPWWSRSHGGHATPGDTPELTAERFFRRLVSDDAWFRLDDEARAQRRAEGQALVADLAAARAGPPFDPSAIVAPVVIARGEHALDRHIRGARTLAAWFTESSVHVIPGAHHGAHLSHPDSLAALVETAIARLV